LTISLVERWVLDQALVAILRLPLVIAIVLLFWYRSTQNHASQGLMLVFYVLVSGCFLSVFIPVFMLQVRRKLALTSIESLGLDDLGQIFPETPQETVGPAPLVSPLLMIRADGDEASKALAIARAGAEAWGMMWHLVRTMARLVSPLVLEVIQLPEAVRSVLRLIVYILGIALMLSMLVRIPSWPYLLAIAAIAWPGVIVGLAVSPFLVGTAVLYSLAFGWEMLFIVYFVNIRATDVPCSATGEMVKVSPEVRRFGQLRHSLHSFLVVPTVIASWINSLPG